MAERDAGTTGRIFWPYVVALSIALVVLLVALYYTFPDVRQAISSVIDVPVSDTTPQEPEVEEVVVIEPTAEFTKTPQPTNTTAPTKTPTVTAAPTNTPTKIPTLIPTPLGGLVWTEDAYWFFLNGPVLQIVMDDDHQRTWPCPSQGIDWSEDADPVVVEYLDRAEFCIFRNVEGTNRWTLPEPEELEELDPEDLPDNYKWLSRHVDFFNLHTYGIPEWSACLFVERNHLLGWDYIEEDGTGRVKEDYLPGYLVEEFGNPNYPAYCPNFDPNSTWCQHNDCPVVSAAIESESE